MAAAVAADVFDAGALKESAFKKVEGLKALARFPNVTRPWVAHSDVDKELVVALRSVMLELKDAKALKKLRIDGFLPATDADYAGTREAIENNYAFFQ